MVESPVNKALANKSILLTGATGFLGKVVLEKLLRSVSGLDKIYLVIRGNSNFETAEARFYGEIASSSIFQRLKQDENIDFYRLCEEKLRFVTAELTLANLGLPHENFQWLSNNIDLVINSAASVDFREPIDSALRINATSLHNLISLTKSRKIPFVQVSTCYVNGFNQGIMREELRHPTGISLDLCPGDYYEVEPLIEIINQQIANVHKQQLNEKETEAAMVKLGVQISKQCGWNDSYTLTKWMGEQLLHKHLQGQSLTILRPSIIESTLKGPVPGWIEGVKVADAIILAYAKQKISFFPGDRNGIIDIIPADLVANSIILSAAEAVLKPKAHRIYQCASSQNNPVKIKEIIQHVQSEALERHHLYEKLFPKKPTKPFVMIPNYAFNGLIFSSYFAVKAKNILAASMGLPKASKLERNLETAIKLSTIFSFYTQPQYTFCSQKLNGMASKMGDATLNEFPVDAKQIQWNSYFAKTHIPGLNNYALQPKSTPLTHQPTESKKPRLVV